MNEYLTKEHLEDTLNLPQNAIQNRIITDTDTMNMHEIVFKAFDSTLLKAVYTALNKSVLWPVNKDGFVQCTPVKEEKITITRWVDL